MTVESDKASMEIPSSTAGVVKEIKVAVGDKVKEGSLLVLVEAEGAAAPAPVAAAPAPAVSSWRASVFTLFPHREHKTQQSCVVPPKES